MVNGLLSESSDDERNTQEGYTTNSGLVDSDSSVKECYGRGAVRLVRTTSDDYRVVLVNLTGITATLFVITELSISLQV